uniref:Lipase-like C-terminal domain-containing protein n=1 Tax=Globisporangium ultimum (strain ATCC 200006 / CBS 805.95 / DAOM BR144) TaxID=431595 RepID=K3WCY2_GLOUD
MAKHRVSSLPQSSTLLAVVVVQLLALWSAPVAAENKFPIVLVHGFAGWGRDELGGGAKYWGGFDGDWQEKLTAQGFDVRTAVIGPFSSDWDRACELYAYIKGGTVNYGNNHAKKHAHNVTGRTFPGLFPEWGQVVNGQVQKVHLIGHSMGGQTARMLAQLLAQGTAGAPIQEDPKSHPLFQGGYDWIHSITTFSTPNQGTTLGSALTVLGDVIVQLVSGLAGALGVPKDDDSALFYDAKLDQFGLARRSKSESLTAYIRRIMNSSLFNGSTKDNCLYSLSTAGAQEENKWVKTLPNVYYYSFSVRNSYEARNFFLKKIALPKPTMFLLLQPFSLILGGRYTVDSLGYPETWLENDGAVNTASMLSDGSGALVEFKSISVPGRWHHMALLDNVDHEGVVGSNPLQHVFNVYAAQAVLLKNLPSWILDTQKRSLRGAAAMGEHTASEAIVRRIQEAVAEANAFNH